MILSPCRYGDSGLVSKLAAYKVSSITPKPVEHALRLIGPVGGAGAIICVTGVAAIAFGVTTAGLWLCAAGVVAVAASRMGWMLTQYQRSVATAMRPLARILRTTRSSVDERDEMVRKVEALLAPSSLADLHSNVVHAMRQSLAQSGADGVIAVRNAIVARQIFEEVRGLNDDYMPLEDRGYVAQLRGMVNDFVTWHDARRVLYHRGAHDAIAQLRMITPPRRKLAVHRDLIEAIVSRDELAQSRRRLIEAGDIDGALEINGSVVEANAHIGTCLRAIRGWI